MSALQDYLKHKLAPLKEKVTLNKRSYEGAFQYQRSKYTDKQIADIIKEGSKPTRDTELDRQRKQYLAEKFGIKKLSFENEPEERAATTVSDLAVSNASRNNENFKQYKGIIDTGETMTAFAMSIKM